MNRFLIALAILLSLSASVHALGTTVQIPSTNVKFDLPAGFVKMPDYMRKIKYLRGTPPDVVYSTPGPSWAVNMAFTLPSDPLPSGGLRAFVTEAESVFKKSPGVEWLGTDWHTVGGREWFSIKFWIPAIDTPVYNDIRGTLIGGKLLLVTANATKAQFPKYQKALTAAMNSLR